MNETVKAALLAERREALQNLDYCASAVGNAHRRLQSAQVERKSAIHRVEDLEAFLRDNGVDLASVDAEAERARVAQSPSGLVRALGVNQNGRGAFELLDPTAGLAKALDEA